MSAWSPIWPWLGLAVTIALLAGVIALAIRSGP
jgi:hypothetical protein